MQLTGPEYMPKSNEDVKQLVLLLHGYGSDGMDLISLAPTLQETLPDSHFIAPNAPHPCDMGGLGFQWFSLSEISETHVIKGLQHVAPIMDQYIDEQLLRFNITEDKLAIIGFSQGAMLALYVALRRKNTLGCVVSFSGLLAGKDLLPTELRTKPPICLVHGTEDVVVPYTSLAQATTHLKSLQVPVESHSRQGLGHGIDSTGVEIGGQFLNKYLI